MEPNKAAELLERLKLLSRALLISTFPEFRKRESVADTIRDRHVVSVQAARPRSTTARPVPTSEARAPCFRAERLELLERLERLEQASPGHGWNYWNRLLSDVFKAMEGRNPQVKRKILSDNPRRFYGI